MKNEIENQNNRTNSEISFARNRRFDADEVELAAMAARGNKKAIACLASRATFFAPSTPEKIAAYAADAVAAAASAASSVKSMKARALAEAEANRLKNIEIKAAKAAKLAAKLAA